ncbi:DNA polymerase III subunit gamma/tau [Rhodocytophaga aerolata]|uniref:DNA polymerase III subunit gamma/tau n=1 Tax=Rhodocytophaga aerolata TaxID=455078 RepID=A0ABT8R6H6_9BACT|nr:DNA polymerase III subunit gamma/tau [Rhodocytophaga aerolata]MDO1447266.1 DNA polymerase III subunit gamma/tau [Rhodocytophaga aerolata]
MDNFVVSARKYRPSTFDSVVGQSHITTTLKNAIRQNHLAQAFLFCGPRGVGKTTCARILAKTINCQNLTPEGEACNTCDSCTSFNKNASFNVHELDAASNNSVDDIRNLVEQVRYAPQAGKYKVYIIDEVHMLSNSAFNAFLKTLEEPPSYAIFILATTEKHKIIPTILSRCQIFDFNRIQIKDISNHLASIARKEEIGAEEEALQLIAQKADGGLRDALSMFDLIVTFSTDRSITYKSTIANLHILDYDYYFAITQALLTENIPQALVTFDEILKKGFDGHNFIVGLCEHFRNLMVCKDNATIQLLQVSGNVQRKYMEQAAQASVSFLLSALNLGSQCDLNYKTSKNQRLHVELTLMKMAHIPSAVNLARGLQNGSIELKKKTDEPASNSPIANGQKPNGQTPTSQVSNGQAVTPSNTPVSPEQPVTNPVPAVAIKENGSHTYTPTAATKPTVKIPFDLKDLEKPVQASAEKDTVAKPTEVLTREHRPFTKEQLENCWKAYAQSRLTDIGYNSEQVILNRPIELQETTILLKLDSQTQMSQLNEFKPLLLEYLRKNMRNFSIELQAEIAPQEAKKMIYTSQEKFKYLAEKHPVLQDLKNRLGLDLEF